MADLSTPMARATWADSNRIEMAQVVKFAGFEACMLPGLNRKIRSMRMTTLSTWYNFLIMRDILGQRSAYQLVGSKQCLPIFRHNDAIS
jgi:hypothetical protein